MTPALLTHLLQPLAQRSRVRDGELRELDELGLCEIALQIGARQRSEQHAPDARRVSRQASPRTQLELQYARRPRANRINHLVPVKHARGHRFIQRMGYRE